MQERTQSEKPSCVCRLCFAHALHPLLAKATDTEPHQHVFFEVEQLGHQEPFSYLAFPLLYSSDSLISQFLSAINRVSFLMLETK
jgi:hypothetical protein